jgi:hypothetical protein
MTIFLLIVSMAFASKDSSLNSIVNSFKPNDVIVQFNEKSSTVDGNLLTLVTGVGHASFDVELTTIRKESDKIKIFQMLYTGVSKKDSIRFDNFYYTLKEGVLPPKVFKDLMKQLSKIHYMNTYKAYEIASDAPVGFKGEQQTDLSGRGKGFSGSSVSYAKLVNVWGEKKKDSFMNFLDTTEMNRKRKH